MVSDLYWWRNPDLGASPEVIAEFESRVVLSAGYPSLGQCEKHTRCPMTTIGFPMPACLSLAARKIYGRSIDLLTEKGYRERTRKQKLPQWPLYGKELEDAIEARGQLLFERALGLKK